MVDDSKNSVSTEAEMGLLSCLMLCESDGSAVDSILSGMSEVFGQDIGSSMYDLRHRTILNAVVKLRSEGKPVDTITLCQSLKDSGDLDGAGGLAYISTIMAAAPSALNAPFYRDILREKLDGRIVLEACTHGLMSMRAAGANAKKVAEGILKRIAFRTDASSTYTSKQIVPMVIDDLQSEATGKGDCISTGWFRFDALVNTVKPGAMIVIGARPSTGKTSIMTSLCGAYGAAGIKVGVLSLEESGKAWIRKMIFCESRVNGRNVAHMDDRERKALLIGAKKVSDFQMVVDDRPCFSREMRFRMQAMASAGCKVVMLDYLQFVQLSETKASTRAEGVGSISTAFKMACRDFGLVGIIASQLNRDLEKEKREPRLSDLRDSGNIEQDADIIILLHVDPKEKERLVCPTTAIVAKQRGGPIGRVSFVFIKPQNRFEEAKNIEEAS